MAAAAYPSAPVPAAPEKQPVAGFFWALGIFVVTAVAGGVLFFLGINEVVNTVDGFDPISAPGQADLELDTGDHWVFAAVPSGSAEDLVDVTITDPGGAVQSLSQQTFPADSADTDGEQFVPLGFFSADTSGTYHFETDGPPGTEVRVGTLSLPKILGFIFGGLALGFIGFVIALIVLIVTLVRRSGRKKRQGAAAYANYPPGQPQYPGQPQSPQQPQQWPPAEQPQQWPPQDPAPPPP